MCLANIGCNAHLLMPWQKSCCISLSWPKSLWTLEYRPATVPSAQEGSIAKQVAGWPLSGNTCQTCVVQPLSRLLHAANAVHHIQCMYETWHQGDAWAPPVQTSSFCLYVLSGCMASIYVRYVLLHHYCVQHLVALESCVLYAQPSS